MYRTCKFILKQYSLLREFVARYTGKRVKNSIFLFELMKILLWKVPYFTVRFFHVYEAYLDQTHSFFASHDLVSPPPNASKVETILLPYLLRSDIIFLT